jgi:drug/metabolite transporter (DMT)-like permease
MTNDTQAVSRPMILLGSRPHADTRRSGFLLVTAAAIAFSTAGLFTRLIASDVWTILFWRGLFGGLLIAGYMVWRYHATTSKTFVSIGWVGLLPAVCSTVATICFITALRQTTVADVTAIYATLRSSPH